MESAQTLSPCRPCDGLGYIMMSSFESDDFSINEHECPWCLGSGYKNQSGDACRHSAQSSEAVGQGGTIHDCRNTSDCLCLKCFDALGSLGGAHE